MTRLEDFRAFSGELVLDSGRPMALEAWQEQMLADYFEGVRETLILLPKKSGKTTLLAALALFELVTTPDAEVVIAAASRDQATLLYDQARGFVRRTPALAAVVTVKRGYRELRRVGDDGRIRVLASDVDTADGVLPTLALVDELHRHKTPDLYGVFRDGLGPRGGRMVTISTAGDDLDTPLGRLRAAAYAAPGLRRNGAHRYARTNAFAMHEWALDDDQDRDDLQLVKQANPASWQTVEALRERRDSPSMTPWQWARFACGVWLAGEGSAITAAEWAACADPDCVIPDGTRGVVIGVDLGWKWDTTAIVPVWQPDAGTPMIVGRPVIVTPPGDGTATPEHAVFDPIEDMARRWPDAAFVLDPNAGGEQLAQRIDVEFGARVATHPQRAWVMATAAQRLAEAISARRLKHPDHPDLNAHVLAAAVASVGEGWRFVKRRRAPAPIDGVIALAMAVSTVIGEASAPRYERAVW